MIKIVADHKIPFLKGALEPFASVVYLPANQINKQTIKDADALIVRTRTICNKALLEGTKVKFIATATIGFDHIEKDYCRENGIVWTNAPGCNSGSVMQYIASALMRLSEKYQFKFSDKTIGIVGHGNVGSKVARFCKTIGMKVLICDPPLQREGKLDYGVSFKELIQKSDIISFHVPLNYAGIDKTFQMADEQFFQSLKNGSILMNCSRGEVVSGKALKSALKSGKLLASVIDVWENEPEIDLKLLDLIDFSTPHIAGYSADGKANGTAMSVNSICHFFGFELKNWFPIDVPLPEKAEIIISSNQNSFEENLREIILKTYDIQDDSQRLKKNASSFEKQRENYSLRREFHVYKVNQLFPEIELTKQLKNIGFEIV